MTDEEFEQWKAALKPDSVAAHNRELSRDLAPFNEGIYRAMVTLELQFGQGHWLGKRFIDAATACAAAEEAKSLHFNSADEDWRIQEHPGAGGEGRGSAGRSRGVDAARPERGCPRVAPLGRAGVGCRYCGVDRGDVEDDELGIFDSVGREHQVRHALHLISSDGNRRVLPNRILRPLPRHHSAEVVHPRSLGQAVEGDANPAFAQGKPATDPFNGHLATVANARTPTPSWATGALATVAR
jgi:hypothetical protein